MQGARATVGERLRSIVKKAFPKRPEVAAAPVGPALRDTWRSLAQAAGVEPWAMAAAIARELGLEVAQDLSRVDGFATRLLPEKVAMECLLLPVREKEGRLLVASACPIPGGGLRRAQFLADRKLEVTVAPAEEVESAIAQAYARAAGRQAAGNGGVIEMSDFTDIELESDVADNAVVRLARSLIMKALNERASDLHIEPFAGGGIVRIRVDGLLRRIAFIPGAFRDAVVRYCKAVAGMDSTNDRIAQDGRMSLIVGNRDVEVRLSVLPASRGESLVIRFLDQGREFRLSSSGLSTAALGALRKLASNSAGVIIVTGPTGSGKSSTLYGMLSEVNRISVKVITIENPVEYRVPGIAQVDVDPKAGLTFASVLRSILRQDPDVILVGEVRDDETAQIAMQAALTGHLVLTTLHTNDALSAITRLTDLGVRPAVLADAVLGIVAQRLLRRLCSHCRAPVREPYTPDERLFFQATGEHPAYRAVGCAKCTFTGYLGRFPVAEIIEMNPLLRRAIADGERDLDKLALLAPGPLSLLAHGAANRVISGDTTALEAMRVMGHKFWMDTSRIFGRSITPAAAAALATEGNLTDGLSVLLFEKTASTLGPALRNAHLRVHQTADPEEAKRLLIQDDTIAMLMVDLDAGDENESLRVLKQLRVSLAWARLPALVIVAPEHAKLAQVLKEHGVTDYLVKPLDGKTVSARLKAILAR